MAKTRILQSGAGRPGIRPVDALADHAHCPRAVRGHLRRRGVRAVIPQSAGQVGHRLRRDRAGGRPSGFDAETYEEGNTVGRCVARLKRWRGLAMRTDGLAIASRAALRLACILVWARR